MHRRILDAIDVQNPTPESTTRAYIYAFLALLCTLLKVTAILSFIASKTHLASNQAEADVQHLWYGRRASTRMRTELMAAIYDKALKRKDLSGIVKTDNKQVAPPNQEKKKGKDEKDENDPKSGADVGKIVNLMAGDANRVSVFPQWLNLVLRPVSLPDL